jgi:hypothetical protein
MPCYNPLLAYRENGKIIFNKPFPFAKGFNLPCGQCIGCKLSYARQWAIRCLHEAQMHESNCFITLTFNDEHLVKRNNPFSLDKSEFQRFMKRLRKTVKNKIRFFHCGEYGEKNGRPHYHALIFGHDFPDKKKFKSKKGTTLYTSEKLAELWPYGFSTVGDITFHSASYTARYITKKITGELADKHYEIINPDTGEVSKKLPEYCTMSRMPGLGQTWFEKFKSDVYPHDYVVINNFKCKPPRFYDNQLSEEELKEVKQKRIDKQDVVYESIDEYDKLWRKEKHKVLQLKSLIRDL